jgi:hypothetical protein
MNTIDAGLMVFALGAPRRQPLRVATGAETHQFERISMARTFAKPVPISGFRAKGTISGI